MKKILFFVAFAAVPALAIAGRNVQYLLDFNRVVEKGVANGQLDKAVALYLHDQEVKGDVVETFQEVSLSKGAARNMITSNIIVNQVKEESAEEIDAKACERSLIATLGLFQQEAKKRNANAVVGLKSRYERKVGSSGDVGKVECTAGHLNARVSLEGKAAVVK